MQPAREGTDGGAWSFLPVPRQVVTAVRLDGEGEGSDELAARQRLRAGDHVAHHDALSTGGSGLDHRQVRKADARGAPRKWYVRGRQPLPPILPVIQVQQREAQQLGRFLESAVQVEQRRLHSGRNSTS